MCPSLIRHSEDECLEGWHADAATLTTDERIAARAQSN
jgi:hypothetical protein